MVDESVMIRTLWLFVLVLDEEYTGEVRRVDD